MHGWPVGRKRALLAAMLSPVALMLVGIGAIGALFASEDPSETIFGIGFGATALAFVIVFAAGLVCLLDATRGERVAAGRDRLAWMLALLLAPSVAGPSYWWLHVRPGPGEEHGLQTLKPARAWPARRKAATGAGTLFTVLFMVAWMIWIVSLGMGEEPSGLAAPMMAAFGVWTLVACLVITLLFLDALREGGEHAMLWGCLLVLLWAFAAPVYWWLYVRPAAPAA